MDKVTIYLLHTSLIQDNLSFVMSFVSTKRKEKADNLSFEKDKLLSLGAGYLLKKYLPKGEIKEKENGKPYIEDGPYFNLSHSGEYVILAIHQSRDVGIDIQKIDENRTSTVLYVLNDEEKKIDDLKALFQIWSNKESLIKCISSGLKDIKRVDGLPLEGIRTIDNAEYYTKSMIHGDYSISLTLKGKDSFKTLIQPIRVLG